MVDDSSPRSTEGINEEAAALTEEQANAIYEQGREAVVFALLKLSKERAELAVKPGQRQEAKISTPSGMMAVYEKPAANRRTKDPGRKEGHPGTRRKRPLVIHKRKEHKLDRCPKCATELPARPARTRKRIIEDIPEVEPQVTEHTIHASYCSNCKEMVEPVVADARRLGKRLRKYREELFRFLDDPAVPADNNHAEREIRPAVIIRKNSLCNRSEEWSEAQAVLMSVYRTLKLRSVDPIRTIASALRQYVQTGVLPPLPPSSTSLG